MKIFSGNSNLPLAKKIVKDLGLSLGRLEITTFADNENRARVIDRVVDEKVVVIESTGISPNHYYMELFFILDSIRRSGAQFITLVVPYLGYQRQDHIFRDGEAVSLEVIIKILESLEVAKVISFDLHSIKIPELFHVPVDHLSALPIFSEEIKKMFKSDYEDVVLVSPDMGGIRRVEELSRLLNGRADFISIDKDRDLNSGSVQSVKINGKVKNTAIIVDDVISTGQTLVSATKLLKKNGAKKVIVMATHGVFSDDAAENLQRSDIEKVVVTDTLDIPVERQFGKLQIVSVSKLIAEALSK